MSPVGLRRHPAVVRRRIDRHGPEAAPEKSDPLQGHRRRRRRTTAKGVAAAAAGLMLVAAGYVSRDSWVPKAGQLWGVSQRSGGQTTGLDGHDQAGAHAGHDHGDDTSLRLSEQARKNIGLQLVTVELRDFCRTINVPALIKKRPGRTDIKVSAPMTGIVTRVYPVRGEAVAAGQPLFDLRLTHEDLVDTQRAFLETVEQLDVIRREVDRIAKVTSSGAVAGKRLLERRYEQQQAEARLRAQRQALVLHGLTEEQVRRIETARRLLQQVTVFAPPPVERTDSHPAGHLLQVSRIDVEPGEHVEAGDLLCVLSDHGTLYIEGRAFEEDSADLTEAATQGTEITALIETSNRGPRTVSGLKIFYVENEVELESRALRFYVELRNELVRDEQTADGHRFIGWRFKPGQRVQLLVPVERWENRLVLPVDAVVREGPEWFVFQENGDRFFRKSVHVQYRDQRWVVLANDGTLFPGDRVAASGAYQIHLAMKNKAGGAAAPHAGHHH